MCSERMCMGQGVCKVELTLYLVCVPMGRHPWRAEAARTQVKRQARIAL